jgi:hypothetical protein
MTQEWPKLDPITQRRICSNCWAGIHYHEWRSRKGFTGKMEHYYVQATALKGKAEHACDGECDCVHRSEETWAAIEQAQKKSNRRDLRNRLKAQLEDPSNPLLANNDAFKPKGHKDHA